MCVCERERRQRDESEWNGGETLARYATTDSHTDPGDALAAARLG